jgi:hypothetical protein
MPRPAGLKAAGFTRRANILCGIRVWEIEVGYGLFGSFSLLKLSRYDLPAGRVSFGGVRFRARDGAADLRYNPIVC